jgi:hypothetical protein
VREELVEQGVLLRRVDGDGVALEREARAARVQPDEVRHEQDHRLGARRDQVLQALHADQPPDALLRRPPQQRMLDDAAREGAKVRARQALALLRRHLRKAFLQVHARHVPALAQEPEQQPAHRVAEGGDGAQRQEMQQPEESNQ